MTALPEWVADPTVPLTDKEIVVYRVELRGSLEAGNAMAVLLYRALARIDRCEAQTLRLAQGLRVLRDTTAPGGYVENVCARALEEAGVPDPPDEDHP